MSKDTRSDFRTARRGAKMPRCQTCIFFHSEIGHAECECRRMPPLAGTAHGRMRFPQTGLDDWCGEWFGQLEQDT